MKLTLGLWLTLLLCWLAVTAEAQSRKKPGRSERKIAWRARKNARCQRMLIPLEHELAVVQRKVEYLSNPVHVHLHGGAEIDLEKSGKHRHHHFGGNSDFSHSHESDEDSDSDSSNDSVEKRRWREHDHGKKHRHDHDSHEKKRGKHGHRGKQSHEKHGRHGKHGHGKDSSGSKESKEKSGSNSSEDEDESGEQRRSGRDQSSQIHIHLNVLAENILGQGHGKSNGREVGGQECPTYPDEYIYARCDMVPNSAHRSVHEVKGSVHFRQKPNHGLNVQVDLSGFAIARGPDSDISRTHGFHVHEFGDFQDGCQSFGGHYNPTGATHGGPGHDGHMGDWGNIKVDMMGVSKTSLNVTSQIYGAHSIIGRGIVLHAEEDDLGRGGTAASHASGNAGARIACCVITHCKPISWGW